MKKRFCTILEEEFSMDRVMDIRYKKGMFNVLCKPNGGLWSSPYLKDDEDGFISEWQRFASTGLSNKKMTYCYSFSLNEDAKVLELDKLEDLEKLVTTYGFEEINPFKKLSVDDVLEKLPFLADKGEEMLQDAIEFFSHQNYLKQLVTLDWESFFKDYDAIYVPSEFSGTMCFVGWDVDTLLIGNKNAINQSSMILEEIKQVPPR